MLVLRASTICQLSSILTAAATPSSSTRTRIRSGNPISNDFRRFRLCPRRSIGRLVTPIALILNPTDMLARRIAIATIRITALDIAAIAPMAIMETLTLAAKTLMSVIIQRYTRAKETV